MAFGTEKLSYLIDIMTTGAQRDLKALGDTSDRELGKGGKAFDTFKTKSSSALDTVKQNAAMFAAAAGASLVAFGVKAVNEFTESALAAGKFADATGLASEDASRWIEIAGDVGVSAEAMRGAFLKLNKEVGEGGGAAEKYGINLLKTADGQADVNATMLQAIKVIGGIKDPTERAAAAQEVFGRSYGEVAEIVLADSEDITKALEGVSDAQVFDSDEVRKAREFRAAMDNLNDKLTALTLTIGEGLTPAVSGAVDQLTMMADAAERLKLVDLASTLYKWDFVTPTGQARILTDAIRGDLVFSVEHFTGTAEDMRAELTKLGATEADITKALEIFAEKQAEAAIETEGGTEALEEFEPSVVNAEHALNDLESVLEGAAAAQKFAAEAADLHRKAEENLLNFLEQKLSTVFTYETATHNLANSNAELAAKIDEVRLAHEAGELSGTEYETALRDLRLQEIGNAEQARDLAAAYAESKGASDGSRASAELQRAKLKELQDQFPQLRDEIQAYIDILNKIPAERSTVVRFTQSGRAVGAGSNAPIARKTGGPVPGPRDAEVPITAHGGEFVLSADVVDAVKRGGTTQGLGASGGSSSGGGMSRADMDYLIQGMASVVLGGINGNSVNQAATLRQGKRP